MKYLRLIVATPILFLLLTASDCSGGPSSPEDHSVSVSGTVRPLLAGYQATDSSRCFEPDGDEVFCKLVEWITRDQVTGLEAGAAIGTLGGSTQISGLMPGDYVVTQRVSPTKGTPQTREHNVTVLEP